MLSVIDNLTNWYIRFNRKRLKGTSGHGIEDTTAALTTLFQVLFTIVRALAPFTPFITEHIYGLLKPYLGNVVAEFEDSRSVHFLPFPTVQETLFDEVIQRKVAIMQKVIELGRVARERCNISLKTPLLTLVVIADASKLSDVQSLQSYVEEELNVRNVIITSEEEKYNILLEARVDWPTLGKKLKKDVQIVRKALPTLTQDQLKGYLREKTLNVGGIQLEENDLTIIRVMGKDNSPSDADGSGPKWEPAFTEDAVILLDTAPHPELADEALAREIINRVQRLRKRAGLVPTNDVRMQYAIVANPDNIDLDRVVSSQKSFFMSSLRGELEEIEASLSDRPQILEEEVNVGNLTLQLRLDQR